MQLFVYSLTNAYFECFLTHKTTIKVVKHYVERRWAIPVAMQQLIHCGKRLEDELTLENYNIVAGSIILLLVRLPSSMQITVRHALSGQTIKLGAEPEDTVETVRSKIRNTWSFPSEYRLVHCGKELLTKSCRLQQCGITDCDTLYLVAKHVQFQIVALVFDPADRSGVRTVSKVWVHGQNTIGVLKCRLHNTIRNRGKPLKKVRLVHNGNEILDNKRTLSECGIKHNTKLCLVLNYYRGAKEKAIWRYRRVCTG